MLFPRGPVVGVWPYIYSPSDYVVQTWPLAILLEIAMRPGQVAKEPVYGLRGRGEFARTPCFRTVDVRADCHCGAMGDPLEYFPCGNQPKNQLSGNRMSVQNTRGP